MRCIYAAAVCLLAAAAALAAPPVELPSEVKGEVGAFVTLRGKTDGAVVKFVPLDAGLAVFPADLLADKKATVVSASKAGRYRVLAYSSVKGDPTEPAVVTVVIGGAEPDDVIPPPKPKPPEPKPEAVTSFRVLLIYESGATLTAEQKAVVYGVEVENAIRAATAGDAAKFGWRRLDKDADPATLPAGLREVWAKAKPALTDVPCVVLQANDKITIESLPATPTAGAELVAKHRGK